jgi:protease-4
VGPSQEIYSELKRVRQELKKPVIASCSGLAASGAYYAAVAADKIVANPGTLMGSIGVIMEFANLEKLYDWAKIRRYTITSGKFKDSGSEYRPMTDEEHKLFQSLISEVYEQFKGAVAESRTKVEKSVLDGYTDGRVFTGATAVKLGFADQLGTLEDAIRVAGEMGGLGKKPKVFRPQKKHDSLMDFISEDTKSQVTHLLAPVQRLQLTGQPLFMLPGTLGL